MLQMCSESIFCIPVEWDGDHSVLLAMRTENFNSGPVVFCSSAVGCYRICGLIHQDDGASFGGVVRKILCGCGADPVGNTVFGSDTGATAVKRAVYRLLEVKQNDRS
jgi:hypothetical protein